MDARLELYSLYLLLLVIDFPDQYKTNKCKSFTTSTFSIFPIITLILSKIEYLYDFD